jgi:hypothetical protein
MRRSSPLASAADVVSTRYQHPKIEMWPLKRVRRSKRNARTHSKKQRQKLLAAIRRFGFMTPVVIDEDGEIIAGHLRFEVASLLGMIAPVQQKALCLWCHAPLARRQLAPLINMLANLIDEDICGDTVFKIQFALPRTTSTRRRHRDNLDALAPPRKLFSRRLPFLVQFVMGLGLVERSIDDRIIGKTHLPPEQRARSLAHRRVRPRALSTVSRRPGAE